ncbi:hypothetical protein [Aquimarina aquimarini]|uniref:hypothetical protein n=1 Tax=Aquimarina aquimarini TaxID=1191734 RepID=UPI000D553354|nr:hypothetical protein [Aquimarina aquimarini]
MKIDFTLEKIELTAKDYLKYVKDIIIYLKSYDDNFNELSTWDEKNKKEFSFENDLSNFDLKNLDKVVIINNNIAYKNPDPSDKKFAKNSKSWAGFNSSFTYKNSNIILNIFQGSYDNMPCKLELIFNDNNLSENYIVDLIYFISEKINISFVNVITTNFFLRVRQKGKKSIGWINYVSNKDFSKYLYENEVKKITDNGVIFKISDKMPLDTDEELVNRSIQLANELARQSKK